MKTKFIIAILFLVRIAIAQDELTGPYFGQTPPGNTPELFAPEVFTIPEDNIKVSRIAFSPDGNECFFSGFLEQYAGTKMFYTKCENNVWSSHEEANFLSGYSCRQPQFSKSGDTLYFSSKKNGTLDIWMVERSKEGWGNPQVLPAPVNTDTTNDGMYTVAPDGTIYIESDRPGNDHIYDVWKISSNQQGELQEPENLGIPVSTIANNNDPVISPDGKFMLLGSDYADLYITFNKENGGWTNPLNLNIFYTNLNKGNQEYAPFLSYDKKYLFFSRQSEGGIFWVSADPIYNVKNINFKPYVKFPIKDTIVLKESIFSYQIPDSTFIDDNGNHTLTYSATLNNGEPIPAKLLNFKL